MEFKTRTTRRINCCAARTDARKSSFHFADAPKMTVRLGLGHATGSFLSRVSPSCKKSVSIRGECRLIFPVIFGRDGARRHKISRGLPANSRYEIFEKSGTYVRSCQLGRVFLRQPDSNLAFRFVCFTFRDKRTRESRYDSVSAPNEARSPQMPLFAGAARATRPYQEFTVAKLGPLSVLRTYRIARY